MRKNLKNTIHIAPEDGQNNASEKEKEITFPESTKTRLFPLLVMIQSLLEHKQCKEVVITSQKNTEDLHPYSLHITRLSLVYRKWDITQLTDIRVAFKAGILNMNGKPKIGKALDIALDHLAVTLKTIANDSNTKAIFIY